MSPMYHKSPKTWKQEAEESEGDVTTEIRATEMQGFDNGKGGP